MDGLLKQRKVKPTLPRSTASEKYDAFKKTYRDDPDGFARDCIRWKKGQGLAPYQSEILAALPREKRVAGRGLHGIGKTMLEAIAVLWYSLTRDGDPEGDWKVVTTASVWRQLDKFLWPEVHKWARRLRWDVIGRSPFDERTELHAMSIKLSTGEAFAVASNKPDQIEGTHAVFLLYLFDESKTIPAPTWDSAEGAFSTAGDQGTEALALALSTPGEPNGRFFEIHDRKAGFEDWWTRAVKLEEALKAGRVTAEWAKQRALQWGVESATYKNRVLGEFASSEESGVIPLHWLEAANQRWMDIIDAIADAFHLQVRPNITTQEQDDERIRQVLAIIHEQKIPLLQFTQLGVDPADGGGDSSVLAPVFGTMLTEYRRSKAWGVMEVCGRAKGVWDKYKSGYLVVDVIGMGSGVVGRLREQDVPVYALHGGARTLARDAQKELGFVNKRSHAYWNLRELLHPELGGNIALPPDDDATGDLTAPTWRVVSGGKIEVEGKPDIKKRLGRSTDTGDGTVYAYFPLPPGALREEAEAGAEPPKVARSGGRPGPAGTPLRFSGRTNGMAGHSSTQRKGGHTRWLNDS